MKKILTIAAMVLLSLAGWAQAPNYNITLAANMTYSGQSLSNIWYYVDELGNEYALVGAQNGISIVNVTNPSAPVQVVQLSGPSSSWREIKTWGNYAYVTTEDGSVGLQIVDLNPLPAAPTVSNVYYWTPTINSQTLSTIHALHIDAGRVYLYGSNIGVGGVLIADISTTPTAPVYLGRWNQNYVHDGFVRNNKCYAGHIYDGWFSIMDVSNPASIPTAVPTQSTPGNFTHNTWLATNNDDTIYTTDEVNNSYLTSYDISNPNNIKELDRIQSQNTGGGSIVHNTHIINVGGNDYAVTSWYKDGVVITDVGRPKNMVNVAWYDTYTQGSGGGFSGCWGVNPFLPSGHLIASDINNGLFVLAPTYQRACYLEGVVTDFVTGLPINTASIVITTPNITSASDPSGWYGTGYAVAGTYSVTYSKPGYVSQNINVTLANGQVTIQNVQLVPIATVSIGGQVIQSWDNAPIPGARVKIWNGTFMFDTITDINGNFVFPTGYTGTYEMMAGKWTYVTRCIPNTVISSSTSSLVIPLDSGIYDDFAFDFLWTRTGTATDGLWQRGEPLGTSNGNSQANPEYDVTPDCYVNAYVTGNTGTSAGDDDVDGGWTMITSQVFDPTGYINPKIEYSRWFYNGGGSGNPNDSLRIQIFNGTTTVNLELVVPSTPGQSTWVNRSFLLNSLIPVTSTMQVRVRAVDTGPGHIMEAGFDHLRISEGSLTGEQEPLNQEQQLVVAPNPFISSTTVMYAFAGAQQNTFISVMDLSGRVLAIYPVSDAVGSVQMDLVLPAGTYFIQANRDGNRIGKPVRVIKVK
ncbi:MAG: choice-of-anchor B family protein [Bacteroidia bacterium]|nr:choice-of-anchor B family protein [Bacteroidia bacterium]